MPRGKGGEMAPKEDSGKNAGPQQLWLITLSVLSDAIAHLIGKML